MTWGNVPVIRVEEVNLPVMVVVIPATEKLWTKPLFWIATELKLVASTVHVPEMSEYTKPAVMDVMLLFTTEKRTDRPLLIDPDHVPSYEIGGVNVAVTDLSPFIVTTHDPEPVHAPVQPANIEVEFGAAVSVT